MIFPRTKSWGVVKDKFIHIHKKKRRNSPVRQRSADRPLRQWGHRRLHVDGRRQQRAVAGRRRRRAAAGRTASRRHIATVVQLGQLVLQIGQRHRFAGAVAATDAARFGYQRRAGSVGRRFGRCERLDGRCRSNGGHQQRIDDHGDGCGDRRRCRRSGGTRIAGRLLLLFDGRLLLWASVK